MKLNPRLTSLAIGGLLIAATVPAMSVDLSDDNLPSYDVEAGRVAFVQTKHLEGIPRPLVSRGYVELSAERVEWVTESPVFNRIIVTQQGVHELKSEVEQHISGSEPVGQLMLALLNQDYQYLQDYFVVESSLEHCLTLTPSREPLMSLYRVIEACGDKHLDSVMLHETQGSHTEIQLHVEQD